MIAAQMYGVQCSRTDAQFSQHFFGIRPPVDIVAQGDQKISLAGLQLCQKPYERLTAAVDIGDYQDALIGAFIVLNQGLHPWRSCFLGQP